MGVSDRDREPGTSQHRQVGRVVADAGGLGGRDAELALQFRERGRLVLDALPDVADAELSCATFDRDGLAARDDRDRDAGAHCGNDTGAVTHVEHLHRFAVRAHVDPPVGQHAVDVEHQQADAAGPVADCRVDHMTPARSRSCTFSAPTSRPSSSTTGSAVIR